MKRVFIIHGWGGYSEEASFPWLKKELESRGFQVFSPEMPNSLQPTIGEWTSFIKQLVGNPDEETFFLGHSIGAQAILRYLEFLSDDTKVGGVVLLAGWMHLTDEAYEDESEIEIGKPWIETPIDWKKVRARTKKFVAIFSDDDPVVPLSDASIFEKELGAKVIIERQKGHFSQSDGIKELPVALDAILEMSK